MDKATQPPPIDRGLMEDVRLPYFDLYSNFFFEDIPYFERASDAIRFSRYLSPGDAHKFLQTYRANLETQIKDYLKETNFIEALPNGKTTIISTLGKAYDINNDPPELAGDVSQIYLRWLQVEYEIRRLQKELEAQSIPFETVYHYWTFPDRDKLTTLVTVLTGMGIILEKESDTAADFFSGVPVKGKLKYKRSLPHFIYLFSCLDNSHHIQDVQQKAAFKHYLSALDYKGKTDILSSDTATQYRNRYNNSRTPPSKRAEKEVGTTLAKLNQITE